MAESLPGAERKLRPGLVATFYSYKGGVGRSMALANVAALLARWGQRVLVIDWDIEAPGLERFFGVHVGGFRRNVPGLLDLVLAFRDNSILDWHSCLLMANLPGGGVVHILHAGQDDRMYLERLNRIRWDDLFDQGIGRYLEDLRNEWRAEYDYILIDSRTGITDVGGICSILLPDYLISMFTTSEQSVLGVRDTMTRARSAQKDLPLDRARLVIIPIAARDESGREYERAALWRKRFAIELAEFYEDWIHKDETAESVLDYLKIPYVPFWSFGEQLPVLEEDPANPKTLAYSYALIARLLHGRLDWSEVREGRQATESAADHVAQVQSRLAEASKVRTEALVQQNEEITRQLDRRESILYARYTHLCKLVTSGITRAAGVGGYRLNNIVCQRRSVFYLENVP